MKKLLFTGIILVLVMMFVVTCEEEPEIDVEYTDVVYSEDGSQVTLYLDGVGVPVTPAQRAVNRDLAMMAYDYFEVVFTGATPPGTTNTARAIWELGERAGIYGVPTGTSGTGINYAFNTTTPANTLASMFVGKKSDKTLLGIGYVTGATPPTSTPGATGTVMIDDKTRTVTFSIAAIKTGLIPETGGYQGIPNTDNSFVCAGATTVARASVNGSPLQYPKYVLPDATNATIAATYTFRYVSTAAGNVFVLVKVIGGAANTPDAPAALKRVPRFMNGGRYMEPKDGWTAVTKVSITDTFGAYSAFTGVINLNFATIQGGTGIFSFYLDIPVVNLTNVDGEFTPAGSAAVTAVKAEKWHIRTGVGSELYSLDDGVANGGCVFMQVGDSSSANWIDIDWIWL